MEMYKADLSEYEKNQLEIKAFNLKKELEQVEKDLRNV